MDLATIGGLVIAIVSILGGQALEGGHIGSILQLTAAMIVFGGTIGAVCVQFPGHVLKEAMRTMVHVFKPPHYDNDYILNTLNRLSSKARRDGLVALEKEVESLSNPFLKKALELAVDGVQYTDIRTVLELELTHHEKHGEQPPKVFEAAGGYAPTVGILGAVLGLIHVMENLSDPSKLGGGIAVAFVATVYGVGSANLLFLPMATKMKTVHQEEIVQMEMIIEGVCAISKGENPQLIARKLEIFVNSRHGGASRAEAGAAAEAASGAAA